MIADERLTRVFLVNEQAVVRRSLEDSLSGEDDFVIVGIAGSADDAVRRVPVVRPDVVILGARLPDSTGIEVCRDIHARAPQTRVLIMTSYDDDRALLAVIISGANGYVVTQLLGTGLAHAIRVARTATALLDPRLVERAVHRAQAGAQRDAGPGPLTDLERSLLSLTAAGLTNRQIADRSSVTERTIEDSISSILAKLDLGPVNIRERRTR